MNKANKEIFRKRACLAVGVSALAVCILSTLLYFMSMSAPATSQSGEDVLSERPAVEQWQEPQNIASPTPAIEEPDASEHPEPPEVHGQTEPVDAPPAALDEAEPELIQTEPINIEPIQLSYREMILGEWFSDEEFRGVNIHSHIFFHDGTGVQVSTWYVHESSSGLSSSDPNSTGVTEMPFTWSIDGTAVSTFNPPTIFSPNGTRRDWEIIESGQETWLHFYNDEGTFAAALSRAMPALPEGYVPAASLLADSRAFEEALRRRFLGSWFFDVTTWTFNEDRTGVVDIPKVGDGTAEQWEFTYRVSEHMFGLDANIWFTFSDGLSIFTGAEFGNRSGGSIYFDTLEMTLTRNFDLTNTPITSQMVSDAMSVITGQFVEDLLISMITE